MGHARPFAFEADYAPAEGISSFLCGTPPVLSLAALEVGVDLALEADMGEVRRKSMRLGHLFQQLMEELLPHGFSLASPPDSEQRASQICFSHPEAYAIIQVGSPSE
eukprot:jgi/Botrbrau1/3946/Bobra.0365s0021.1